MEENKQENEKTKKPFYKKWWFILIVIIVAFLLITNISYDMNHNKKIKWSTLELGQYLPEPDKARGRTNSNSSTGLNIVLTKVSDEDYKEYKIKCRNAGYTIDENDSSTSFEAFNNEGYKIRLSYTTSGKELSIYLDAPEKLSEIEWPTSGLGAMLPAPKSNLGKITWDTSKGFTAHIGNTPLKDFNEYIKLCEDKGYTVDHSKSEKSYYAKNADGYKLSLNYAGNNTIYISLSVADSSSSTTTNTNTTENTTTNTSSSTSTTTENTSSSTSNSTGLRPDFKKAMDSYESFMDEYVAFMKKYSSGSSNTSLLTDYSNYMTKYAQACKDFEQWNSSSLNKEEAAYYFDVQTRVNKKLLEVAN